MSKNLNFLRLKVFDACSSHLKDFKCYHINPWLEVVGQEVASILLNSPDALIYFLLGVADCTAALLENMNSSDNVSRVASLIVAS